ncbi:cold-shock protein [Nocardia terpenica]|uniref:CSD domain-containing protein n=1 Tax=Nocardia terpenica TaxID=455432 RepID=A0A6G9Z9G0_9NOCA|nr:cold shock domain-containing protein [Nocardia terpenica]QIS22031.1 hypothetical protein F6W96_30490 [Nocardia terpenica]
MAKTTTAQQTESYGTVVWFDAAKGFGFIAPVDRRSIPVFVEFSNIELPGYRTLVAGQAVTFVRSFGRNGVEATRVRPVTPG